MAIGLGDNLRYSGAKPDFVRQQYRTVAEMASVSDAKLPDLYLVYCLETQKVYLYKKTNTVDAVYGKFRVFSQVSYTPDSIQQEELPSASADNFGKVYQYIGPDTPVYRQASFYRCSYSADKGYFWTLQEVDKISAIPNEEIERVFEEI